MPAMEIWVRKCSSFAEEQQADPEFWAQVFPDDRVVAVDELRQQWLRSRGETDEGLRRTVRVLQAPER